MNLSQAKIVDLEEKIIAGNKACLEASSCLRKRIDRKETINDRDYWGTVWLNTRALISSAQALEKSLGKEFGF